MFELEYSDAERWSLEHLYFSRLEALESLLNENKDFFESRDPSVFEVDDKGKRIRGIEIKVALGE